MMKKQYSAPDIFFEEFSLSTSIAAGCEEKPFNQTSDCGVQGPKGQTLFSTEINGCKKKVISGSAEANGLCYHNPYDNYNVFFS
jgi:hypothetical protein